MRFVKARVVMTHFGQEINNVLYYGNQIDSPIGYDPATLESLGEAIFDAWHPAVTDLLGRLTRIERVECIEINERGETTGLVTTESGEPSVTASPAASFGSAGVAIVSFRTGRVTTPTVVRPLRRSYIALGPMREDMVDDDGSILFSASQQAAIVAAVAQGHLIGALQFEPYRIGVPNQQQIPGVSTVTGALVRSQVSFRRSRVGTA